MTLRTLFSIILKILGVFFIKDFLALIPQALSSFLYLTKADTVTEAIWTFVLTLLILFIYGLVSYNLIFKSNLIIDKLKLDKGFAQETISLDIHQSTILSIAVIVIGGLLVVEEVPNFCRQLFSYFQEKRMTHGMTNPTISYAIVSAVKILIGLLLIGEQKRIVKLIERQQRG